MESLPASLLEEINTPEVTQLYTADGKKAGRQIRHRWHLIFVPDEPDPEPLPKTLLPTAVALLLTVMLVSRSRKKLRR